MALLAGTRGPSSQRGSWDAACARTYTRSSRGMKCSDYVMLVLIPNPEPTAPPPGAAGLTPLLLHVPGLSTDAGSTLPLWLLLVVNGLLVRFAPHSERSTLNNNPLVFIQAVMVDFPDGTVA